MKRADKQVISVALVYLVNLIYGVINSKFIRCTIMKNVATLCCIFLLFLSGMAQAQKVKIFKAKVFHFDNSRSKGIVYDVSPLGMVLLDTKTVSGMAAGSIREVISKNQLPSFTVPFNEVRLMNIKRRKSAGKGFGLGYLASFVTLETIMVVSNLSSNRIDCDGSRQKMSFGDAVIGASCAAPPGILIIGIVSFVGGGFGSLIGSIPVKKISLNAENQEADAREKLTKYAIISQINRIN